MNPFRRRKYWEKQGKIKYTVKNCEALLEQLYTTFNCNRYPIRNFHSRELKIEIRNFSSKELKLATNNYNTKNITIIDLGDKYKLYKGFLLDRHISVMKYESKDEYYVCIENIVFSSQMCHKNILKLIGCCLETKIPILVFESFVKHETLKLGPIIDNRREFNLEPLSWKQRLNISMEIAHVFAYLHFGFPRPVVYDFHCSGKILLDEHCVPKLYDFSKAACIPERKTHIKRIGLKETIPGVARYIAPEQFIDEKCDVYGFGAFLLELLTGRWILDLMKEYPEGSSETTSKNFWYKIICVDKVLESNSETKVCNKLIENNCSIIEVVDPVIVGDGLSSEAQQQLIVFADLAIKCQSVTPENRPKMNDVTEQLRHFLDINLRDGMMIKEDGSAEVKNDSKSAGKKPVASSQKTCPSHSDGSTSSPGMSASMSTQIAKPSNIDGIGGFSEEEFSTSCNLL